MGCENSVMQFVQHGYGYKEIQLPCGSTGIRGQQLLCEECESKAEIEFPHGWRDTPGDTCEHGTYIGTPGGIDYICGKCESF
jgi:hypothetical protein